MTHPSEIIGQAYTLASALAHFDTDALTAAVDALTNAAHTAELTAEAKRHAEIARALDTARRVVLSAFDAVNA